MAAHSVFEYLEYKTYLSDCFPVKGKQRGARAKLAAVLNCQGAYISQVLNGHTHFSLEHAILIDEFLEHTEEESHYFMLLVHYGRAGSKKLENYYRRQIDETKKKRKEISERIKVTHRISKMDQVTYYGSWIYAAIHVLVLVPELRTKTALASHLQLPSSLVAEVLEFLRQTGLVVETGGEFQATQARIHLETSSPMLPKHHANWRMRALNALEQRIPDNLHYSGPIALSRANAEKLRKLLLSTIEQMEPIVADSGEEVGYCFCLDYFKL